jgi:hypothetical protein
MTAVCGKCGGVYWVVKGHKCARRAARSCAHLPRSRSARLAAEVAELKLRVDEYDTAWGIIGEASAPVPAPPAPPANAVPRRHLAALPEGATAAIARALLQGEAAS